MQSLLSIEWMKVRQYRTFWVLVGLFAVLFPLWNFGINGGLIQFGPGVNLLGESSSYGDIWPNVGFYASHFVIFLSILTAILVTNEYQYRTNRQNVIDGWSRLQFYHAKWAVVLVMAVLTTLFVFLTGIVMGITKDADFSRLGDNINKLLWLFILSLNYYGFALMLSLFLKRSGLAIGLLLLYYMMIETMLHLYFFYKQKWFVADFFLPLQSSDEMLRWPSLDNLNKLAKIGADIPTWQYAVASLCWIVVYYLVGRIRLLRSDW